jgi:hypothetical protein
MERDAGNNPAALAFARKLADVLPGDPGVARLIAELEAATPR